MSSAFLNTLCADQIIDALVKSGVGAFFLSPGSRCTPLAMAIAKNSSARSFIHYDERGMAFMALGFAKASLKPAVVITTSGSAVGHLLPAIMEAHQSRLPLIVLTSDRPPELIDVGANQTTEQNKVFSSYVRWEHTLATPSTSIDERYVTATMAYGVFAAAKGPVHINCPFREPLYEKNVESPAFHTPTYYENSVFMPDEAALEKWAEILSQEKEGFILLGEAAITSLEEAESVKNLAKILGWPILADILSGYRSYEKECIHYYQSIIKAGSATLPKIVLQFGGRIVLKGTGEWIKDLKTRAHFQVIAHEDRIDPLFRITHRLMSKALPFCQMITPYLSQNTDLNFLHDWQEKEKLTADIIKEQVNTKISEPGVMQRLSSCIEEDTTIFCGSSMPIRDADHFFYPENKKISFFASRGVSGIDGNIATACGIALAKNEPTLTILGDTAALHDLNSLALLKICPKPMLLLIINNDGCGIFSFLPIAEENPHFERFFGCSHGLEFSHAAKLFNLNYRFSEDIDEVEKILSQLSSLKESLILEVKTSRVQNFELHQSLDRAIQEALCCTLTASPT